MEFNTKYTTLKTKDQTIQEKFDLILDDYEARLDYLKEKADYYGFKPKCPRLPNSHSGLIGFKTRLHNWENELNKFTKSVNEQITKL